MSVQLSPLNTGFLCTKHRLTLQDNPKQATAAWAKLIQSARAHAFDKRWQEAVRFYGNAFEVAQIILQQSESLNDANRYIRSAIELVFALRHSNTHVNIEQLIATLMQGLEQYFSTEESKQISAPVRDIASSPLAEAKRKMTLFYVIESRHGQTIH